MAWPHITSGFSATKEPFTLETFHGKLEAAFTVLVFKHF
jgi:hypothetical protein